MERHQLTELQKKLLEMFKWFHGYCTDNEIRYYCLGGTMLGAVRHRGFIPWDDDIDVGLPRKDYEKLLTLAGGRENGAYYLESAKQGEKDFLYSYAKLHDIGTTLVENTRYKIKRGIYIDVFPLDGMGNTEIEALANYKKITPYLNLLAARSCALNKSRKFYKNVAILIARCIPNFLFSNRKLISEINSKSQKRAFDDFEYISNVDGNWRAREIIKRSVFGTPQIYSFNGQDVYGVSDPDAYLTHMYGEWKKLPSAEQQRTHHDYVFMDLNHGYFKK